MPEAPPSADSIPEGEPVEVHCPLVRLLWEQTSGQPVAERIIDGAMRALFLEGFTIEPLEEDENSFKRKAGVGVAGKDIIDGIDVEALWYNHVGPCSSEDPKTSEKSFQSEPSDDTRENRCLALQLLLASLCGGAPAVVLKEDAEEEANEAKKPPSRGRGAVKETPEKAAEIASEQAQAADVAHRKQLISDVRFLAYLQDPERNVPWRGELLFSLLGLTLDYDPHGLGVPYGGIFSGKKEENIVSLALQVLGLLLQCGGNLHIADEVALLSRKPQELLGETSPILPCVDSNVFHIFLARIAAEHEVEFIGDGIATIFGTVSEERRSYLPGSTRLPCFLPELLVLVYHFCGCGDFVKGLCSSQRRDSDLDAPSLADSVLQLGFQGPPENVKEDDVVYIVMITLLRLTAHREFCDKLNEEYDGDVPDDLPDFKGSYADLVALAALKAASDKIGTSQVNHLHRCIVEVAFCTLCNISSFAEGLCMETCHRLFKLFERMSKVSVLRKGRSSIGVWLPHILQVFQNIVQYQYGPNVDIIYGLMTREAMLRDLVSLCNEAPGAIADQTKDTNGSGTAASMPQEWWDQVQARLHPVTMLLNAVVPTLTAEVEKNEVSSPADAKKFLPRTALGLLPVPHAFELRSIRGNVTQHRACERCLVHSVAHGPSGMLWEEEEQDEEEEPQATSTSKSAGNNSERKRNRSSSLSRRQARGADNGKATSSRARSSSRTRRSAAEAKDEVAGAQTAQPVPVSPAPSVPAAAPAAANLAAVPAVNDALQAQLQAAAASGVDISALMQALAAQQAPAAAAATAACPPPTEAAVPAANP